MKRVVISVLILIIGVGVLAYPFASEYLQKRNGSYVSDRYDTETAALDQAQRDRLWQEAEAYNARIGGSVFPDPFADDTAKDASKEYNALLQVNGMMALVEIPKIDVKLPIYHGTTEAVLQKGAGHLEGSSLPIGGESRHSVITGHTGLPNKKLFTNLTVLAEDDEFYINVLGETLAYAVDQIKVVEPGDTQDLRINQGADHVTLITCTPYGINSHRLLIRGSRVPYDPVKKAATKKVNTLSEEQKLLIKVGGITAGIMTLLILVKLWLNRRG